MYLILDDNNIWQASTNTLEKAKQLLKDVKEVDKKIWGNKNIKLAKYKIVKEIEI